MRKNGLSGLVIAALVLAILGLLNPKQADFKAYLSAQASAQAAKGGEGGLIGSISKGVGAVAGGVAGLGSGLFQRKDYVLFSTFSSGGKGPLYLGLAKLFVKLR